MSRLQGLLASGKITQFDYKTYLLFSSEMGAPYLRDMIHTYYMEEPAAIASDTPFAWLDGRRSVWRDLQNSMDRVNNLLNGGHDNDDGSGSDGSGSV